jgi:RNA polymerase sigma factor (TIGR02999 family)
MIGNRDGINGCTKIHCLSPSKCLYFKQNCEKNCVSAHNAQFSVKDHNKKTDFFEKTLPAALFASEMTEKSNKKELSAPEITQLLSALNEGNRDAVDALIPMVYAELRRLAAHYLKGERGEHTLQPTALVHEAFLKLVEQETPWQNRAHFFAMAASLMRRILVDYARGHKAEKRGGAVEKIPLEEAFVFAREKPAQMLALDEALKRLTEMDARRGQIVELKFFGGLTNEEIAEVLGVHSNTVLRDWNLARAWLKTQL